MIFFIFQHRQDKNVKQAKTEQGQPQGLAQLLLMYGKVKMLSSTDKIFKQAGIALGSQSKLS